MNRQEILHEINKAKEHLANMEKVLKECKYERCKPKKNETYYFVNSFGEVDQDLGSTGFISDIKRYYAYNCFETKEQAKQESEKILVRRQLEDIAKRLNKGKKIDWKNYNQSKCFICIQEDGKGITWDIEDRYKRQGVVYCLKTNFIDVAIQEIGEERLEKYLRGE